MSDIARDYSFGGWISHLRHAAGLTLRSAADKMEMDAGNLSRLERSEYDPPRSAKKIEGICEALNAPDAVHLLKSIAFQHHLSKLHKEFFE